MTQETETNSGKRTTSPQTPGMKNNQKEREKKEKNSLNIIQINLNHSYAATEQLKTNLQTFENDVTCVQEPYYSKNKVIGFSMKDIIIQCKEKPRTAIVIHKKQFDIHIEKAERDITAVRLKTKDEDFLIINVYAPPNADINETIREIKTISEKYETVPLLILGDFNAKNPAWGGKLLDRRGETLGEYILGNELHPINDQDSAPTFTSSNGRSWIDLTIASQNLLPRVNSWKILDEITESDHNYIEIKLFNTIKNNTKRLTKKGEIRFIEEITNDDWLMKNKNRQIESKEALEQILNILIEKLKNLYKKHVQRVRESTQQNPWWSPELEMERKQTRAMRRRYQQCNSTMRPAYKSVYLQAQKKYKTNVKKAKNDSWQQFCTEATRKNIFGIPYKIAFDKMKKPIVIPAIITPNGESTKSLEESITTILTAHFPPDTPENYSNSKKVIRDSTALPPETENDIPFSEIELENTIKNIPNRIATGPDNLTTGIIKAISTKHANLILNIFNGCLKYGYYPPSWKETKAILIPKPSKPPSDTSSYRPICINSILGKVLEKLLNNRIYYYLYSKQLLHPKQYGFTHGTSATKALLKIKEVLKENITSKEKSLLISLDISNAFNTIWIPHVLKKLKDYKLPKNLYALLQTVLSERIIKYETVSANITVKNPIGSPQGSPLSPLIWNIFITNLLDIPLPDHAHIQAFADDVTIIIKGNTRSELEQRANAMLEIVNKWSKEHEVKFNKQKCQYLTIGKDYKKRHPVVKFGDQNLKHTEELKILGVIFDRNLSFIPHANYLKSKTYKNTTSLAAFSGLKWGIKPKQFRDIYIKSIERSIVYAAPVFWKNMKNSHLLRKLISVQRIPMIRITKAYRTVSNNCLNVLTNIKPIDITLDKEVAAFYVFQNKEDYSINEKEYTADKVQHQVDIWKSHPAKQYAVPFATSNETPEQTQYKIYTDGSIAKGSAGASYIIMDRHESVTVMKKIKLPNYATIFDAEMIAIQEAIKETLSFPDNTTFALFSDSLSSLKALANPYNQNPIVHETKNLIKTLLQKQKLSMHHVRSHTNIDGNDLADKLANEARKTGRPIEIKTSKKFIKKEMEEDARERWDRAWSQSEVDIELHSWIPSIHQIPNSNQPPSNTAVNQPWKISILL